MNKKLPVLKFKKKWILNLTNIFSDATIKTVAKTTRYKYIFGFNY